MAGVDLERLNDSQRDVATRLDEPLFVAAGAGSGKTFTLTARLVHALSMGSAADGGRYLDSIDQALVITFTKAAALEIAERVRGALRAAGADDAHLHEESLKVDGAWISTIHGMCSRILKRHAIELGIDPKFKMCEGSVAEALMARALDEVMREAQYDESLQALRDEYPLWGAGTSVVSMIGLLRDEAHKCANGFDGIVCPNSRQTSMCMDRLLQAFQSLDGLKLSANQQRIVTQSLDALQSYCQSAPGARTPQAASAALASVKTPVIRKADVKPMIDDLKQLIAEAWVCAQYERVQDLAPQLVELARRVEGRYASLKLERSYLDNDDLISLALEALERHPQVAADYTSRFKLVMIDEFQDTDAKQLRLIGMLAGKDACHLTTVGDAQQSIYRFRGGDVKVFRARGKALPPKAHVRMDVNYRSDAHVLAVVERVCGDAHLLEDFLKLAGNGMRSSRLVSAYADGSRVPRVRLEIASGATAEVRSATIAAQLADRLASYHAAGQPQSDMALLLGAATNVGLYLDALRARGLDAVVTGGSSFSSTREVGVVQALLHTLANPHDTQTGLFRLLSSQMFMLDANDFCQLGSKAQDKIDAPTKRPVEECFVNGELRLYGGAKPSARLAAAHMVIRRAFGRLGRWQLADVCQAVVDESGWLERLEAEGPDGLAHAANVLAALRYVRELTQDLGLGTGRAADEFDRWLMASKLTPKFLSGDVVDAVRVMTVHGSKGLQFGVCAVAECWGNPKTGACMSVGQLQDRCVVCAKPRDVPRNFSTQRKLVEVPTDQGSCESVAEWALFLERLGVCEELGEKARLLYVALTRAEEALIVGVPVSDEQQHQSTLAMGMLQAFSELEELSAGEVVVDVAPQAPVEVEVRTTAADGTVRVCRQPAAIEPGIARVVCLSRNSKDEPWQADSNGTLAGFDGELPESVSRIPVLGAAATEGSAGTRAPAFTLFEDEVANKALVSYGWRVREGVFSYSSVHELLEQLHREDGSSDHTARSTRPPVPSKEQQDAEAEGAAFTRDADKATSLGSAFHELAQTMVETRRDHDPSRAEALARTWRLSERQVRRLGEAIARWENSDLRREVWRYDLVRAEVPFFVRIDSPYGDYVEGAIDLLACDVAQTQALVVDYKTGDVGLSEEQIRERHRTQANFYAWVLLNQGFADVECAFCCVEVDDGSGEPVVVRYHFNKHNPPTLGAAAL